MSNWPYPETTKEYVCVVCGHVHDEELEGLWDTLPDDFSCPECGVGKNEYITI